MVEKKTKVAAAPSLPATKAAKPLQPRPAEIAAVEVAVTVEGEAIKVLKTEKSKKTKLVRDSYTMPESEYARIGELKKRLAAQGESAKKSELLRAGIALLTTLGDGELKAALGRIERIKTGRPGKK